MSDFAVATENAHIDAVLADWCDRIGPDFTPYRNHVYRMFNLARYLLARSGLNDPHGEDKLAIAAAFHDLGIWPEGTLDYLPPSIERAQAYLTAVGHPEWAEEVAALIGDHHKLRAADALPLAEVFRQADYADFTLGLIRFGLPRTVTRAVDRAFPNAGFHKRLTQLWFAWVARNPTRPLPMFRY